MRNEIKKAMAYNRLVHIVYQSERGNITQRKIKVMQLDETHVYAFCFLRQSRRSFKLNNILASELLPLRKDMVMS